MEKNKQIFESAGKKRWKRVQWAGRLLGVIFLLLLTTLIITLYLGSLPGLPNLESKSKAFANAINVKNPLVLKNRQNERYNGFKKFMQNKLRQDSLQQLRKRKIFRAQNPNLVRAAFYVPWDPASLRDLAVHGSSLNMIFPEWFFIDSVHHTLETRIDTASLRYMQQYNIRILPMLSNFNTKKGEFDSRLSNAIFSNEKVQAQFITQTVQVLKQYKFQGLNVDFEELNGSGLALVNFERKLGKALHENGLLLTTDIPANDDDYDIVALNELNDYLVLMAYDEFNNATGPGPVSSQKWIEKIVDQVTDKIPTDKVILGVAGYGGEWINGKYSKSISYEDPISMANQVGGNIYFDDDTYNLEFDYTDEDEDGNMVKHQMWFTDAATTFNVLRFSDEYPMAGTSLWRLGTEDKRIWRFYDRNLSDAALAKNPFHYDSLLTLPRSTKVTFQGDGEVLDILKGPQNGFVKIELDTTGQLISEEHYTQLPSGYLIRKFAEDTTVGKGHKLILTFDDGPSAEWTPQILSILEKKKVPATFFVVGIQAEQNIPLIRREYEDGYEIGNHTFTHHNIAEMSHQRAALEMKLTRLLIESVTGHSTILFRAPYNADAQPQTFEELAPIQQSRQENYLTINEGVDPQDWAPGISADSIVARVIRDVETSNASIILLHDAGGESRAATVAALPRIIDYFQAKGYVFSTVGGLMGKTRDELMPLVADSRDRWTNKFNFLFAEGTFLTGYFLFYLFMMAIILSILRMIFMIILASIQRKKDKKVINLAGIKFEKGVSVIIPAYNEEVNCVRTVNSMLSQDYPILEVIFVDDGSKDNTYHKIAETFNGNSKVRVFTKPNGGKASALNYGILQAQYEYLVCVDADTQLKSDAIKWLMSKFEEGKVDAVAGNVKVGNEVNMLTKWQSIEYITSQNFDRRAFDLLNCITVIPGAIGAFRKEALVASGGFTTDTLAEDCDLTMRLLRNGYVVRNSIEAISYTEAPETVSQFFKQRFRWSFGVMQCFWKHRVALFNPRYKYFGMVAMPNILLFQIILTMLAPLADLVLVLSIILASLQVIPLNVMHILFYYLLFTFVDMVGAVIAFAFEKENMKKLLWVFPQRLVYRQMMYFILIKSIKRALKGEIQHWGSLIRTGNVKDKTATQV